MAELSEDDVIEILGPVSEISRWSRDRSARSSISWSGRAGSLARAARRSNSGNRVRPANAQSTAASGGDGSARRHCGAAGTTNPGVVSGDGDDHRCRRRDQDGDRGREHGDGGRQRRDQPVAAGPEGPPVGRHGRHRGSRNHGMPSSTQTRRERILTAPSRWIGRLTPRLRPEMRPSA